MPLKIAMQDDRTKHDLSNVP